MRARPPAIRLADFDQLRRAGRRTAALRGGLLLAAIVLFAGAFLASRGAGSELGALLPAGTSPIVVLDISASISGPTDQRVLATLQTLAGSKGTAGLVIFSDTGYELLPPDAPTQELRTFERFFTPNAGGASTYPPNPWLQNFKAGTRISAGLDEARFAIRRAEIRKGSVILVSDLNDPEDPSVLAASLAALRDAGIELRVVPLFPFAKDLKLWETLVGSSSIAASPSLPTSPQSGRIAEQHPFHPGLPAGLIAFAALLVLVLAANERWCGRLVLGGRP